MKRLFRQLYITNFFFYVLAGIIALFAVSFLFPVLYNLAWYFLLLLLTFFLLDCIILFGAKTGMEATRISPEKLSNGDENPIRISIRNYYTFSIFTKIIDEIPFQFQVRNFNSSKFLLSKLLNSIFKSIISLFILLSF